MSCQTNGQTQGLCANVSFNSATNQISTPGYTYDAAGNMTADGSHTYQWDAEGRLESIDNGSTETEVYNALGQWVESRPSAYNMEQLYDPAEQITGIYNSTGYNNNGVPYWWAENVRLGGRLLAYNICCEYREVFLHKNTLGTTTLTLDHSGSVLEDQLLYPWGQMWTHAGQLQGYGFAGLDYTNSTGLYPTLNRMYTTTLGRWMTPDPLAGDISNPQSLNRYAYALNNPTTLIDPLGLDSLGINAINCRPGTAGCKVLPSCHGMVCADQYYGGSMYPGFTSADQTTCTIDGVSANCNSAIADLQNGSATLQSVNATNPGAVGGGSGTITLEIPGGCVTTGPNPPPCHASPTFETVSLPGVGPSLGLIPGSLAPGANGALQALKAATRSVRPTPQSPLRWVPDPRQSPVDALKVDTWWARAMGVLGNALQQIQGNVGTFNTTPFFIPTPCFVPSFQSFQACGGAGAGID